MNSHQDKPQADGLISKQQIASLFKGWKRLFVKKMNDDDWQSDTVTVWYIALNDLGMTQSEFEISKRKSLGMQWACTAPADFLALARQGVKSKYPDSYTAFKFACENEGKTADIKKPYDHAVIYETVKRIGSFSLKQADDKFFSTWDRTYQAVIAEYEQGADFTIPQSNRVEHKHFAADDNVAKDHLAKIKAMLAGVGV